MQIKRTPARIRSAAYTFTEVMVAVAIIGVMMVSLYTGISTSFGIIQRTREKGILKGLPSQMCRLHYVSRAADVQVGDKIVTSGLDRIYPKGLPVGEETEVLDTPWEFFKDVRVRPSADFAKLEEVLVLLREDPLSSPSQRTK